jgi:hypothetical protein
LVMAAEEDTLKHQGGGKEKRRSLQPPREWLSQKQCQDKVSTPCERTQFRV